MLGPQEIHQVSVSTTIQNDESQQKAATQLKLEKSWSKASGRQVWVTCTGKIFKPAEGKGNIKQIVEKLSCRNISYVHYLVTEMRVVIFVLLVFYVYIYECLCCMYLGILSFVNKLSHKNIKYLSDNKPRRKSSFI